VAALVETASKDRAHLKLVRDYQASWGFLIAGLGILVVSALLILTFPSWSGGVLRVVVVEMAGTIALLGAIFVAVNGILLRRERLSLRV
jgi:hypothetical protein